MKRLGLIFGVLVLTFQPLLRAQQKPLTIDDLFDPDKKIDFSGRLPSGVRWLADGQHFLQRSDDGNQWLSVDARSGSTSVFLELSRLQQAFAGIPGMTAGRARSAARRRFSLAPGDDALLIQYTGNLFYYSIKDDFLRQLTRSSSPDQIPAFSPDGKMVAFTRDNDLFVVDVQSARETQLTTDGSRTLLNGHLDWVYQEEVFGRGDFKGYWWSPDSSQIAYLQLDDSPVPEYTIVDQIPVAPQLNVAPYPRSGEPNPVARLGVVSVLGGGTQWIDTSRYGGGEYLIVRVTWDTHNKVVFQVQNREQTWLDLDRGEPGDGTLTRLIHESSKAWVDVLGQPVWLKDGSFLWRSERSGFAHLYHYSAAGKLLAPVTSGSWEVRTVHGVDQENNWIYFSGTRDSPIESQVYRVRLDGSSLSRISQRAGSHRARFNSQLSLYLDRWSDIKTPPKLLLTDASGNSVRTVAENKVEALDDYQFGTPEFLQVKTRDGFVMEALMVKPPGFDPSKRYPVMCYTYSGPHLQMVVNRWGGTRMLWHHLLADKGYIIWICDNRTASGKGVQSTWPLYQRFGRQELMDLEDGWNWLKQQPYVDGSRIGLWGWSFGGFMTSYALTHSTMLKIGIVGAPVTDWHLYDSVYTERYMRMPQNNPEGYKSTSVLRAAAHLHGKMLLIHGTADDNVHTQNSLKFVYALEKANKQFRVMFYPKQHHGFRDPHLIKHMYQMMTNFVLENL